MKSAPSSSPAAPVDRRSALRQLMVMRSMLLLLVVALPSVALAHHHHFGHDFHAGSGTGEVPLVCVRWESDLADAGTEAGVDAGQACSCEVALADDGGLDAGDASHVGEHCVEYGPAFGCSVGSGVLPVLASLVLRRRRA